MKTERMTILVSLEEKASINARAETLKIPAAEFVRRAVTSYDPDTEDKELATLAEELERVVDATEKKLDHALDAIEAFRSAMASTRQPDQEVPA